VKIKQTDDGRTQSDETRLFVQKTRCLALQLFKTTPHVEMGPISERFSIIYTLMHTSINMYKVSL